MSRADTLVVSRKQSLASGSIEAVVSDDRGFETVATAEAERFAHADIRDHELVRARRALAYLKARIGDHGMRTLVAADLAAMTEVVRGWVEASGGRWRSGSVTLRLPGPGAVAFRDWYTWVVAQGRSNMMRAGHPEHYLNTPGPEGIEVVEPLGETVLPWRVFYRSLPTDAVLPSDWDADFAVRFAAEILDGDGLRVGYSMRALRDVEGGMEIRLTSHLPAAAPAELMQRHLHHFMIEYRNWCVIAMDEGSPRPAIPTLVLSQAVV